MEKALLNLSKVNHKKPYERCFFGMQNPSGTRNACSQFSIIVQCNVLSQEVQGYYWWTALQNLFGWQTET